MLTPGQILDGLGNALGLLAEGPRVVLPRHQTIAASIAWSHSLLSEGERVLFRRLAAFAGPFTLDAAEAIVADDVLAMVQVLDLLEHLVDQSLVQMDDTGPEARFRVLETVRQFAAAGTRGVPAKTTRSPHGTPRTSPTAPRGLWPLFHSGMTQLSNQADAEYDDLVAMLAYLGTNGTEQEYGEVALACLPCLSIRHVLEANAWAERVAERLGDELTTLNGRFHAQLRGGGGRPGPARRHTEVVMEVAEATGDPEAVAWSNVLGRVDAVPGRSRTGSL